MKHENVITTIIKSGSIQLFLAIVGVAVTLLSIWLTTLIAPIKQDHALLEAEVKAHEEANRTLNIDLQKDIEEIKQDVKYIRLKLER